MKYMRILLLLAGLFVVNFISQHDATAPAPTFEAIAQSINVMAQEGATIELSKHARERMTERHVSLDDIRNVLAHGRIIKAPRTGYKGDTIYKLEQKDTRGTKDGEVAVIKREKSLFIVTVMWDGA